MSIAGVACLAALVATAQAGETRADSTIRNRRLVHESTHQIGRMKQEVILVQVTGSRIPQRVVLFGRQVNSASPLFVIQGNDLVRTGATSVSEILSIDPSIRFGTGGRGR